MDFSQALILLKQGKKLQRVSWPGNDMGYWYIYLLDTANGIVCVMQKVTTSESYILSLQDILAENWSLA